MKWVAGALVVILLAGPAHAAPNKTTQQVNAARTMLARLKVGNLVNYVYDRTGNFGREWVDVDGNGCDTRNDILARDLTGETFRDSCLIATGRLLDRYTGAVMDFVRGPQSANVPIDHIVPLHLAWQLGATKWPFGKRVAFANDPLNLMATDRSSNSSKSDQGPDTWLPAATGYQCTYVIRFTRVMYLYGLRITPSMKQSIKYELDTCKNVVGSPATMQALSPALWDRAASLG